MQLCNIHILHSEMTHPAMTEKCMQNTRSFIPARFLASILLEFANLDGSNCIRKCVEPWNNTQQYHKKKDIHNLNHNSKHNNESPCHHPTPRHIVYHCDCCRRKRARCSSIDTSCEDHKLSQNQACTIQRGIPIHRRPHRRVVSLKSHLTSIHLARAQSGKFVSRLL